MEILYCLHIANMHGKQNIKTLFVLLFEAI